MEKRIKQIRKEAGLTQSEFAAKIGVKPATLGNYEQGIRTPFDAVVTSICREFGISEDWLRNGIGDMIIETDAAKVDRMAREAGLSPTGTRLLHVVAEALAELDEPTANAVFACLKDAIRRETEVDALIDEHDRKTADNSESAAE